MAKFRHKKTGKVVEVDLLYYVNQLRTSPDYKEIKETNEVKEKTKKVEKEKPLK